VKKRSLAALSREQAEAAADEIIRYMPGRRSLPIDPLEFAAAEDIVVRQDPRFEQWFDGRLEYLAGVGFVMYCAGIEGAPLSPRGRFTVGHELGHYHLHRARLLAGERPHNSRVDFISTNEMEREADWFSASLLMPRSMLTSRINLSTPSMSLVKVLAEECAMSWTSTAIRVAELCHFPCLLVSSVDGVVEFWHASGALRSALPRGWSVKAGNVLPEGSAAARLVATLDDTGARDICLSRWAPHEIDGDPTGYEEALRAGDRVLSLVTFDERDFGADEDEDEGDEDETPFWDRPRDK
jgi:uncharacterized protein DUF955